MPLIHFVTHDGNSKEVEAESGGSVMQAAVDNGVDAIVAECGGSCSCATCHCYVDEAWIGKLDQPSEIEQEMLECALEPQANSRLSCQIKVGDELDGIVIRLPKSQF